MNHSTNLFAYETESENIFEHDFAFSFGKDNIDESWHHCCPKPQMHLCYVSKLWQICMWTGSRDSRLALWRVDEMDEHKTSPMTSLYIPEYAIKKPLFSKTCEKAVKVRALSINHTKKASLLLLFIIPSLPLKWNSWLVSILQQMGPFKHFQNFIS